MISFYEAKEIILHNTSSLKEIETVNLDESYGRILANNIISPRNIPQYDNSSMDGYAVISNDTIKASTDIPVSLVVSAEIQAGGKYTKPPLTSGHAIRIMTGAHIPPGADAVIPFEDTEEKNGIVKLLRPVSVSENIRFSGEDIVRDDLLIAAGTKIDSAQIGQIASVNLTEITVFKKPDVFILSTGDEIVEPGTDEIDGKIINSNASVIINEVKKYGGTPHYIGIARDNFTDISKQFSTALQGDLIICSGGVSMGLYDFTHDVIKSSGAEILFHNIAMKPGKPVLAGKINNKLIFGLPGNPVSVMVSFMELVRPALLKMSGSNWLDKPVVKAILEEQIIKKDKRIHFVRGIYTIDNGEFHVKTAGIQRSDILRSMSSANCFIILPEKIDVFSTGSIVDIQLIQHGEISV